MKETNPTSEHLTSAVEEGKIPAYRHTETLVLAVQQLNSFPVSKEVMQKNMAQRNWKISQVEKLIGLSRRDIQRACYNGRGGIAILEPKDSSWGKRTYDYEDIAKLFIIKRLRDQGMSLFQTKEQFETFDKESHDYSMLDIQLSLMVSELDALERQIACARALSIATNKKRSSEELDALLYSETLKAIIKRQLNYRTNATFLSI